MTINVTSTEECAADEPQGLGCLRTLNGNLPLHKLDVRAAITGLVARTELVQGFHNPYDTPLEATYVFPLPDRAAVTAMTMTADGRTVVADLQERAKARANYDAAVAAGRRASIAEEERPDVFTMRVGNIAVGERVEIALTIVGPLPFEDGEATFRIPLVVAPRYIPGRPLRGGPVGDGYAPDTDSTPDASRITPPVLLPGFPNPVDLSIEVALDPAGLPLGQVRSSLHAVTVEGDTIRLLPGERVNRDFLLRIPYGDAALATAISACPDDATAEGSFQFTVLPPPPGDGARGKDVVLLLDRSGSMQGWKMVAARRAAARIVDTLGTADRFTVLTFDNHVEWPDGLPAGLAPATDRYRYRAVEHLGRAEARGGTEILQPLEAGLRLLNGTDAKRDSVLVLITDGQVGNEDQIIRDTASLIRDVRVHTVGIDQAVNAGFLARLAVAGGGRCELVESEDRLDEAMDSIHRRIAAPLVTGLQLSGDGVIADSVTPSRLPDVFSGVPLVLRGRYRNAPPTITLTGRSSDGASWQTTAVPTLTGDRVVTQIWARAALRDLEDAYVAAPTDRLEQRIVATSLRFGVLCRFTAFVAVDVRTVNEGDELHRVLQPVEAPAGWDPYPSKPAALFADAAAGAMPVEVSVSGVSAVTPASAAPVRGGGRQQRRVRPVADDVLTTARRVAAREARHLAQPGRSEQERRDRLEDLASRLDMLARELECESVDATPLRAIIKLLRDSGIPTIDRANRARRALMQFARTDRARAQFWKQST